MLIALFDPDTENRTRLKEWLISYTIRKNTDFYLLSFSDGQSLLKMRKYASCLTFAFISLDCQNGITVGQSLAHENPDCFICYYSRRVCSMRPLMHSRPFELLMGRLSRELFDSVLDAMLQELIQSKGAYRCESRQSIRYYPVHDILYLQSDLKYVTIQTLTASVFGNTDDADRLYAKLSDVALELGKQGILKSFVRVHKSYLVNLHHIRRVDKRGRRILLISKEELPVSEACYKTALEQIEAFQSLLSSKPEELIPLESSHPQNGIT